VGGTSDIVRPGETGLLVPPGDVDTLAGALAAAAADRPALARMGAAARDHVAARYSSDRLIRDVDALYTRLLRERSPTVHPVSPLRPESAHVR